MTILVTGGAGFIGSAVCRRLVQVHGRAVVNLDKLTYAGNLASLAEIADHPDYAFVHGDIADRALVDRVFAEHRPEAVLHLAAESHVDRSIDGPLDFVTTNMLGTAVMLEAARGYVAGLDAAGKARFRFVHVSTDEVFGSLGAEGFFNESTAYDPSSPYSASKAGSDHLARAWGRTYGLPVIVTNCSNNFGPRQFPEKLIPLMILKAMRGEPLPVYGDGGNIRDWLHVDDHAEALIRVIEAGQPGETYAIGARAERSNLDIVRQICALMDKARPEGAPHARLITFVTDRPGHDRRYAIDSGHIETTLGWRPRHGFEAALSETVAWYLARRDWWEPILTGAYRGERLGQTAGMEGSAA